MKKANTTKIIPVITWSKARPVVLCVAIISILGGVFFFAGAAHDVPAIDDATYQTRAAAQETVTYAVWAENQLGGGSVVKLAPPHMPGVEVHLLEFPEALIIAAAVAPGGEWLALVTEDNKTQTLWLAGVDGSWPRRVDVGYSFSQLTWSSDGQRLFYVADRGAEAILTGKQGETTPVKVFTDRLYRLAPANLQKWMLVEAPVNHQIWLLGEKNDSSAVLYAQLEGQDGPYTLHSVSMAGLTLPLPPYLAEWAEMDELVWPAPDGTRLLKAEADTMVLDILDSHMAWTVGNLERGFSARWLGMSNELVFTEYDREANVTMVHTIDAATGTRHKFAELEPAGEWQIVGATQDLRWIAAYEYQQGLRFIATFDGQQFLGAKASGGIIFAGWLENPVLNLAGLWRDNHEAADASWSSLAETTSTPPPTPDITHTLTVTPGQSATPPAGTMTPTSASTAGDTYLPIIMKPVECPMPYVCPISRHYGYQPSRPDLKPLFIDAAENRLGGNAPTYFQALRGLPPDVEYVTISPAIPLPHLLLRGTAYQESIWVQFLHSWSNPDDRDGCTVLSFDCGYGMMQITSCMADGCGWFSPQRVSSELLYNMGTGASFLINKWNGIPYYLGENDPTAASDWYYALIGYNGFGSRNDPNNLNCDPRRAPYLEGPIVCSYPYQERVHGWLAHPELATMAGQRAWRPTRIAEVPRGIFGLGASWFPPTFTNRPLTHLFHDIEIVNGVGPELVVHNTTSSTQALDIILYNRNGTFNRRWLDPSSQPPWYLSPYIRLDEGEQRTIEIAEVFPGGTSMIITARVIATEGINLTMNYLNQQSPTPLLEPSSTGETADRSETAACTNLLANGDFEAFFNGRPMGWNSLSAEGYPLADSTWFWSGHFGAYLGGYNNAEDLLSQDVVLPDEFESIGLSYIWFVRSEEQDGAPEVVDRLVIDLFDAQGQLIVSLPGPTNQDKSNNWRSTSHDNLRDLLLPHAGEVVRLSFRATTDGARPTSFFLDEVILQVCAGGD